MTIAIAAKLRPALAAIFAVGLTALAGCSSSSPTTGSSNPTLLTSSTTLTASSTAPGVGTSVILIAQVSPAATTGTVTFYSNGASIGTGTLNNNIAELVTSFATAGTYSVSALYGGSTTYNGSASAVTSITVYNQTPVTTTTTTTTTLTSSASSVAANANFTLTATVTPTSSGVTGTVSFYDSAVALGSAVIGGSGVATLTTSLATVGTHYLAAVYAGNSAYASSVSSPVNVVITGAVTTAPLSSGGAGYVYVEEQNSSTNAYTILQYAATVGGTVNPTASLTPTSGFQLGCIATDIAGQIYVGGLSGSTYEVLVYAAGATGSATPSRTINLGSSTTASPSAMVVDSSSLLYIASSTGISVYSSTASGAATPLRSITGASTQLTEVLGIAVDGAANIYVTNYPSGVTTPLGQIFVFGPTATGNVAPTRTITSTAGEYLGIASDAAGDIYTDLSNVVEFNGTPTAITAAIYEYAAGASGTPTPVRTITGPATLLNDGGGMRLDSAGNLYMVNANITSYTAFTATFNLLGFGPTASGNEPPAVNFSSTAWIDGGGQLALH